MSEERVEGTDVGAKRLRLDEETWCSSRGAEVKEGPVLAKEPLGCEPNEKGEKAEEAAVASLYLPFIDELQGQPSTSKNETPRNVCDQDAKNKRTLCVRGLPEWIDENELKAIFIRAKEALAELSLGYNISAAHVNQQCVTDVQIIRDPESQKCVGYGYVELMDHAQALLLLQSQSSLHLEVPNSNKSLTLSWAPASVSSSPSFENYHFYLGNIRPGLSDRSVARVLRAMHPAVLSVRLVPQELLGLAPLYVDPRTSHSADSREKDLLHTASVNFYRAPHPPLKRASLRQSQPPHEIGAASTPSLAAMGHPPSTDSVRQSVGVSELPESRNKDEATSRREQEVVQPDEGSCGWGCGFVRIKYQGNEWTSILSTLRKKVNSELGHPLHRCVVPAFHHEGKSQIHPSSLCMIRPMFDKFDDDKSHTSTSGPRKSGGMKVRQSHTANMGEPSRTVVFVGNLAEGTTEEDLNVLFTPFGQVLSVRIAFLKRVGFVELADHRVALAALSHLPGSTVKKSRLYFDWGRCRRTQLQLPRHIEIESVVDHSSFLSEKTFASQWMQSMQPQKPTEEVAAQSTSSGGLARAPTSQLTSASTPHPNLPQSFWLASLCASLPTRPPQSSRSDED